jgi:hypothetical protein
MRLFCFASRSVENIRRGIEAKRWAVAKVTDTAMKARITKAERNLRPGDLGLLYCNPLHAFTVPFIVETRADPGAVITNVWPEPWVLPFDIAPLGDLRRSVEQNDAMGRWPIIQKRLAPSGGVSAAMNITGTTVFVPVEIELADWRIILDDLANLTEQ